MLNQQLHHMIPKFVQIETEVVRGQVLLLPFLLFKINVATSEDC